MEIKLLENYKMRNSVLFLLVLFLTIPGCKRSVKADIHSIDGNQNKYKEINFINNEFKAVIDSFIIKTEIHPIDQYNDILVYLYKDKGDTILRLDNSPPFERDNLKSVFSYNNFDLYFYAPESLEHKLDRFIKNEVKNQKIERIEIDTVTIIDPVYMISYFINNNKIKRRNIPLEWSTDSIR